MALRDWDPKIIAKTVSKATMKDPKRPAALPPAIDGFDVHRRYVRVQRVRDDGFVEFEFAVGEPGLSVDLILPAEAFREFCAANEVDAISSIDVCAHGGRSEA